MFHTPILLITFNRPDHVRRVLSEIRKQRPQEFFIAQDGPREGNERDKEKISEVRKVINKLVDWPCNLHTLYQETNLGCGPGPAAAISWYFENVEMGIIIEDDAVPHQDFFPYCEELLERYKDDKDVRAIGSMHLDNRTYGDGSYYFSMMNRIFCAWATWKRAWNDFDMYHRKVTRKQFVNVLKSYGCCLRMREYWCDRLEEIQKDAYNHSSWDQQFWMSIWLNSGKGIMPNVNLCTNIGFDESGTHTKDNSSPAANENTYPILPLTHPTSCEIVHESDERFQRIYFEPWNYGQEGRKFLLCRVNKRIKRLCGYKGSWFKLIGIDNPFKK